MRIILLDRIVCRCCPHCAVGTDSWQHIRVPALARYGWQYLRRGPVRMCAIGFGIGMGFKNHRWVQNKQCPHRINAPVMRTGGICVGCEPLLVRNIGVRIGCRHQIIGLAFVRGDPACSRRFAGQGFCRMHRHGNGLGRNRGVCLVCAVVILLEAKLVVVELVRQHQRIEITPRVKSANGIGVVGPTFITRHMALHRPCLAAIEGFIEAEQMAVSLSADGPFGLPDQMP